MGLKTIDYPYCRFPFPEWNPVQEKCLPFFTEDKNLIVSASVAAGKTAIAEAVMGYELSFPGAKAVYVSPLKALSAEKFQEWSEHETFKHFSILVMDSDHEVTTAQLESAQLLISTVESMNIRCRKQESWLQDIRVLVFDEAHLFEQKRRGACAEALMMALSEQNPKCRLVCLSGTLSNTREIASWCHELNGKGTQFLASEWRPTQLVKCIKTIENLDEQFQFITQNIQNFPDKKILLFVHSKKIGELLRQKLRDHLIRCAFYSADLEQEQREKLVKKFRSAFSGLNVLIATSSLSQGVSL